MATDNWLATIDWQQHRAAVWRVYSQQFKAVTAIDPIQLDDLQGLAKQRQQLFDNTERFLHNQPANHALLWGSRGTGKSSLIKAVFNHYHQFESCSLRLIQIDKAHLQILPELTDHLRDLPFRFIIFVDDLAFAEGDDSYQPLKTILEGSIELPPENILLYATSNRRHLVIEHQQDNHATAIVDGELHYGDAVEEKISLSDRFGLWLAFHPNNMQAYFQLVETLCSDYCQQAQIDENTLHNAARLYAMSRGSHSPRTAQQFYKHFVEQT